MASFRRQFSSESMRGGQLETGIRATASYEEETNKENSINTP